jgi:ABC-type antimicrobial peptide transport system permease subunit
MHLGRGFTANEDTAGESSAIVLSHAYWQRRFNADVSIIGQTITLQGQPFTVVGVTEPGFIGTTPDPPSFWAPLLARDQLIQAGGWAHKTWLTARDVEVFTLLGRLAPNVSTSEAEAAVQLTTDRLAQKYPSDDRKSVVKLERAGTFVTLDEDLSALVLPLAIGFGLVLLVQTKSRYLLVQTRTDPAATMSLVHGLATSIDPLLRTSVRRLDTSLDVQTVPFRALAWVSGALGLLALVLASLGLYGVTSFLVARRTHEIGIRMALGARARDVVALFLREGLKLTLLGIVLGVAGGVALSRLLVSVLVDLSSLDPIVFATVSLFLVFVASAAILAAPRRATKVDPMVALRYE